MENQRSSSPTPSAVHFHGSPGDDLEAAPDGGSGYIPHDHSALVVAKAATRAGVVEPEDDMGNNGGEGRKRGETETGDVDHVRIVMPATDGGTDETMRDRALSDVRKGSDAGGRGVNFSDTAIDIADGKARGNGQPALHRAKSVSHWHDSRISVEMHLALYIEDAMMMAPGVAAEGKQARTGDAGHAAGGHAGGAESSTAQSSVVGSSVASAAPDLPVEFDEDAEPDITLQHVLAGMEYLLQTRIIGSAEPDGNVAGGNIAEGDEDENENPLEEHKQEEGEKASPSPDDGGLTGHGLPAPLANAPPTLVAAGVNSTSSEAAFKPATTKGHAHPYFYFVSLDLALCDDLVTVLCYHMRRAEQKWSYRPKASAEAMKALELFEGFFRYVYSFRCCVAARSVSYLRTSLKVSRHLRSSNPAHRKCVVRVVLLLAKECPRISSWEELVDADEQPRVRELLTQTDMKKLMKKLASAGNGRNHEREQSTSQAFRTSRQGSQHSAGEKGAHELSKGGSHALLEQSFPAFYSTRHHQLLPPKGALFDVEPQRLLAMFKSNAEKGLATEEIEERQKMYGKNELPPPHQPHFLVLLWGQLKDFIILVLMAAAVVSLAIQDWEAAGVLFFVVAVNVTIGLVQEHRSHNALKALNSFAIPQAQVLRDGVVSIVPASELVPGDLCILEEGANIPADLRLIQVSQLSTIEAILTGESLPILKSTPAIKVRGRRYLPVGDRINMAFMNTLVSKGRATGIVVNTGATTEVGRIYSALSSSSESAVLTPLQRKLAKLGKWLVLVSVVACGLVIAIGLGRGYGTDIITIGISLAVSVIPEGLVTVVTLTMAIGTQRMAKRKAIVRNLPAVETLGAITTICSDKTGTLTEGKMKTESMWVLAQGAQPAGASSSDAAAAPAGKAGGHTLRFITAAKGARAPAAPVTLPASAASSSSSSPAPTVSVGPQSIVPVTAVLNDSLTLSSAAQMPPALQWHNLICSLNNNATVKVQELVDDNGKKSEEEVMVGDATEVALLRATQQAFAGVKHWETSIVGGMKRVMEFAFDSDRKRMSVIVALPPSSAQGGGEPAAANDTFVGVQRPEGVTHVLLVKGAPEAVLNRSVSHLSAASPAAGPGPEGTLALVPLSESIESRIEEEGSLMAGDGMRVLATAFRFLTRAQVEKYQKDQADAIKDAEAAALSGAAKAASAEGGVAAPSAADLSCQSAESDLCFVGLAGIMDPPRVEVAEAIRVAHVAGIRVCMITGDHYDTAVSIARQIGIYSEAAGDRAMNGDALAVLSEEQLAALTPFPVVFSRVSPDNKLKLVKALQKRGDICAMTGDGVNDSPAIKASDVGIAMGLGGTEVTRQSADIILSDDNFSTIVVSVGEGRRIYDNIVKFLVYLLTCNGAEVWVMLFAVIIGIPVPFLSLMLLWANIFVDIPPSLSLGLESGELDAMNRPPRPADQGILTLRDAFIIAYDSGFMAVLLLVNFYHCYEYRNEHLEYARTFAFMLLAMLHMVHSFEARSLTITMFRRDVFSANPTLAGAFVVSTAFLILGCYCPGLNEVIELVPLRALEWGIIAINLVAHIIAVELRKAVLRYLQSKSEARLRAEKEAQTRRQAQAVELMTLQVDKQAADTPAPLQPAH